MIPSAEELLAPLPAYLARTRRRAARAIAVRLGAGDTLIDAAHHALDERDSMRLGFDTVVDANMQAARSDRATTLREAFLAAYARPPTRAEARAMKHGRLSLEALEARVRRRIAQLDAEAEVAFLAAQARETTAGALPEALAGLALRLAHDPGWRLCRTGLTALAQHAHAGHPCSAAAVTWAETLACDPSAPVWSQTAALALLGAALGEEAVPLLARRLVPSGNADDVFVRSAALRLLVRASPSGARAQLAALCNDPSEYVRIELARELAALGDCDTLLTLTDPKRETSARVRAAAAIALARVTPTALAAILNSDPEEIPRRAALEEAEIHARTDPALARAITDLSINAPWPELRRLAAEAAERVHHETNSTAAQALALLRPTVGQIPEGEFGTLEAALDDAVVGRALAVLSTHDFGFQASRAGSRWRLLRGDRWARRWWRVVHEVRNPSPDKRQSYRHTVGRLGFGEVRAPSGGLAEVTATKVPGERVVAPALGDWGRYLPTVDDLLARPASGSCDIYSAFGVTKVRFPSGRRWLHARFELGLHYARYVRQRWTTLTGAELRDRREYVQTLERLGFSFAFAPHREGGPAEIVALFASSPTNPAARAAPLAGAGGLAVGELVRQWLDPSATTVNHMAAVGVVSLGLFLVRLHEARREIERARGAIPLCIGGWGTRGKSGTERLKAALFHSLGCEVLVKTTGCEAMLIHCLPGLPGSEVFIYRTYDKATIWEQRDLLRLAERFGVDVFLWECMALNPEYVAMLEQQWMRDDFCTLTNAYPDHENIQGPAGIDIPRVMTRFIPPERTLFTAEEQMLPIWTRAAAATQTKLVEVRWRDHALLPSDLLARFPYDEHPRNIALVVKLAEELGIERDVALKEMADWVVPDLGVLKTYPEATWRGRRLVFSNGMSANERTGFLNNWVRCGFDRHQPDDVGEWIVTVVNNRADRVSRSMVFADIVVEDARAHTHVLIGTNLAGLSGFIGTSLASALATLTLFHDDESALAAHAQVGLCTARASRALAQLKLGTLGPARLAAEALAMARGLGHEGAAPEAALFAAVFADASAESGRSLATARVHTARTLATPLAEFATALGAHGPDAVAHLTELTARHLVFRRWHEELAPACAGDTQARHLHEQRFRDLYRQVFLATLVPLWNAAQSGDQIVDAIARLCPPGFRVRIMGIQNIKGTGLDFAYRWVHFDRTVRTARALADSCGPTALRLARDLDAEGTGVLDCVVAEQALGRAAASHGEPERSMFAALHKRMGERRADKERALVNDNGARGLSWKAAIEKLLDVWDGIPRLWRARRVMNDLVAGRLSHASAAEQMRDLMKRQKGGWLFARINKRRAVPD